MSDDYRKELAQRDIKVEKSDFNINKEKQIKEELLLSQPERFFWEYSFKGARGYFTLIYCTGEGRCV